MIPSILFYFALLIGIGIYGRQRATICSDKALDYFLGGRRLGIFPMAMTMAATYVSASSFIGGPGMAYKQGLAWVFLAAVQYPVALLLMGIVGQHLRHLGARHELYDLPDYIRLRYRSRLYAKFCAAFVAIVLLLGLMVALLGGCRLLQGALPNLNYRQALLIFSLALGCYTLFGGLRAVVLSDILQGAWMLIASIALLVFLYHKAGGSTGLAQFAATEPDLFSADNGGRLPLGYTLNFTILVGFGMVVQPISFSRLLAFDRQKSLRQSILISLLVIGVLTLIPHFIGFLGRIVLPGLNRPDQLMGRISGLLRSPEYGKLGGIFSGLLVSAMLAAIMSTADSALHTLNLTIYRHLLPRNLNRWRPRRPSRKGENRLKTLKTSEQTHFLYSRLISAAATLFVALLALRPPALLVAVNLYALGATQAALFWPVVLGIFTRRPNARAACASSITGLAAYFLLNRYFPNFGGAGLLPWALGLALLAYVTVFLWRTESKFPLSGKKSK